MCQALQPEHFGILCLPVAELLALLHGTSYAGYSNVESLQRTHPFFSRAQAVASAIRSRVKAWCLLIHAEQSISS